MKNKDTIVLAKIRKLIRRAIDWSKVNDGMPTFYSSLDYRYSRKMKRSPSPQNIQIEGNVTVETYLRFKDRLKLLLFYRKWKFVCRNPLIKFEEVRN